MGTPTICLIILLCLIGHVPLIGVCSFISADTLKHNLGFARLQQSAYLVLEFTNLAQYKFKYYTFITCQKGCNFTVFTLNLWIRELYWVNFVFHLVFQDRSLDYGLRKTPSLI